MTQTLAMCPQATRDAFAMHVPTSQKQRLSMQATVTEVYHCKKRALWLTQHQILFQM